VEGELDPQRTLISQIVALSSRLCLYKLWDGDAWLCVAEAALTGETRGLTFFWLLFSTLQAYKLWG
jgi:hypothetical protein